MLVRTKSLRRNSVCWYGNIIDLFFNFIEISKINWLTIMVTIIIWCRYNIGNRKHTPFKQAGMLTKSIHTITGVIRKIILDTIKKKWHFLFLRKEIKEKKHVFYEDIFMEGFNILNTTHYFLTFIIQLT